MGLEELKDMVYFVVLLVQFKFFYDVWLLCDVIIEVVMFGSGFGMGCLFFCNCNVLVVVCFYFKSMFIGGMYESQQVSVIMYDVDVEFFEVLVDYCYMGCVFFSEVNVECLYVVFDMLQLEYVWEVCVFFLV